MNNVPIKGNLLPYNMVEYICNGMNNTFPEVCKEVLGIKGRVNYIL